MPLFQERDLWKLAKTRKAINEKMYTPIADLDVNAWVTREPVRYAKRRFGRRIELKPGKKWGDLFDCAWFHFKGRVPKEAAGRKTVLLIDVNGEACVVDRKGVPVRGLTNVNSRFDRNLGLPGKRVVQFLNRAKGGERVDLWAEAGCNCLFGRYHENGTLKEAQVAVCNESLRALHYDWEVLLELAEKLPDDSTRRQEICAALVRAERHLSSFSESEARSARAILKPILDKKSENASFTVSAVGHAHIDLGWLWPIRETIRKGGRTFATMAEMMRRYPDYVFGASQAQLYQWVKDRYPALYGKVKRLVAEGRMEVQGPAWVECDSNVPSGESLVRQLLLGNRFFEKEFGVTARTHWLPDCFGFSGALPQILKKAGLDSFLTTKMSWNQVNTIPHDSFMWKGIDGSAVLTHMPPEKNYNSSAMPRAVLKAEREYKNRDVSERCLILFGIGDGGGGPGAEHLERLQREKSLNGLPPVVQEPSSTFFKRLEKDRDRYPVWCGELYLEHHQGCFTSEARNKRYNRKLEFGLRELEWQAVLASRLAGKAYPSQELDAIWKEVLLYQFHDILPGSSITRVYDESLARYATMTEQVEKLQAKSDAAIGARIDTRGMKKPVMVSNSLSWQRQEWVKIGRQWAQVEVPSMGYRVIDAARIAAPESELKATGRLLENDRLRIRFNARGALSSVRDKQTGRQVLRKGQAGNRLAVYEDHGSAWDFPPDYRDKPPKYFRLESSEPMIDGPRATLKQRYRFGDSVLEQEVRLHVGSARIDFVTTVDWRESAKTLRTSFAVDVLATESVSEIQFGYIKRATHENTSWDVARTEACAHKWVDLSQRDYGVALLNDCKYGHFVRDGFMDLCLLRSTSHPDPVADRARHEFTYALFPHTGDHVRGGVIQEGYQLNRPLRTLPIKVHAGELESDHSFFTVDKENVIIETVKQAEDGDEIIVRMYEAYGASADARLSTTLDVKRADLVDLMERPIRKLALSRGRVKVSFKPFEIQTIRLKV